MIRPLLLASVFLIVSCQKNKPQEGILSKKEMVKVLSEIYIAEDKVQRLGVRADSATKAFAHMNEKISEQTGIPDSVFQRSMRYYMERPKELEVIYSALVDSLNLMEQRSSSGNQEE